MQMQLKAIAQAVSGELIGEDVVITGVSIDTRTLAAGQLYVAIRGHRLDGHEFVSDAEQLGAAAILVERSLSTKLPQIVVRDTRLALAELAGYWRNSLPVKVVGVTGSNGKTTVKEMTAAILATDGATLATRGNFNNDIGVPLTLLRIEPAHRYAVIEMGANHPGEIAYTSRYANAQVSLINNVGAAHIEGFGDIDGVAAAKSEIFASLGADGIAILNRDDAYYDFWRGIVGSRPFITFGLSAGAEVRAENIESGLDENGFTTRFELKTASASQPIRINLAGTHNVRNALAATSIALALGLSLEQVSQGLEKVRPVTGRLQPLIGRQGSIVIDDTYNANPSSLQAALEVMQQIGGEIWLALGAFGELGDNSIEMHTTMGKTLKAMHVKRLYATGELARHTVESFGEGGQFFDDQRALIAELTGVINGRQTILVKGSRSQKMENVVAALVDNFRA